MISFRLWHAKCSAGFVDFRVKIPVGQSEEGNMADRMHFGKPYPGSPRPTKTFTSEAKRWEMMALTLQDVERCVPRFERDFFQQLVALRAYCEHRGLGSVPKGEEWAGQLNLRFGDCSLTGGMTKPSA